MAALYESEFQLTGSPLGPIEAVELTNPVGSGVNVFILRVGANAQCGFALWVIRRYSAQPSHGTGGDAPSAATIWKRKTADATSATEVWVQTTAASIVPNGATKNYEHTESLDPSDAGDDAEIILAKYAEDIDTLVIAPGESMTLQAPQADLTFTVNITWEEAAV